MNLLLSRMLLRKFAFGALTLIACGYFILYAGRHVGEIPDLSWNFSVFSVFFLSVGLVVISIGVNGTIWHLLLRERRVAFAWLDSVRIVCISQFAKYVPGNIGQHVGRVLLAKNSGIPLPVIVSTMVFEIFWSAATAVGLTFVALLFFMDVGLPELGFELGASELLAIWGILVAGPWVGSLFISKFSPALAERMWGGDGAGVPSFRAGLIVAALYIFCFLAMGLVLKLQTLWIFEVEAGSVISFTCMFAVAWLAGYLVPGAPGGLGVRESVMLLLFSPVIGAGTAVGLSVTARIATTLGDGVAFVIGRFLPKVTQGGISSWKKA